MSGRDLGSSAEAGIGGSAMFTWSDGSFRRAVVSVMGLVAALLIAPPARAEKVTTEGVLSVRWADPRPGKAGGGTFFRLQTTDGRRISVDIGPDLATQAIIAQGKRVRVDGETRADAAGLPHIDATGITVLSTTSGAATLATTVTTKKVLFILLKFKGDAQEPHAPSFYKNLTNPLVPPSGSNLPATINGFFDKTSYQHLQWKADVVGKGGLSPTGWLTLPKTKAGYANCGWNYTCADTDTIETDALKLVTALGVEVSGYDSLAFVLNNDLDCCAWGGSVYYGGKSYGATWEPPWGQETGTYVHELGHSLGLPHSGWVYYAYDSPWDEMSDGTDASTLTCGSYRSANSSNAVTKLDCTEPGSGYIAAHRAYLGWIPAANQVVVSAKGTQTVTLEATAAPLGTGKKLIKICLPDRSCTGSSAHYFSVEARMRLAGYEKGLPGEGVLIHDVLMKRSSISNATSCFFNLQFGWAVPIDRTRGDYNSSACNSGGRTTPNWGLYNAQYGVGTTYTNATMGVTVQVVSKSATGYVVKVTRSK